MNEKLMLTGKQRRRIRSRHFPDMRPHIFDKLCQAIPYVFMGYEPKD